MKNKILAVALAIAMLSVISVSMASAAVAYVSPTASQYIPSGLFYVNVTYVNASDITDPTPFGSGNSSIFFNDVMFSTYNGNRNCSVTNCWAQIRSDDTGIPEGTYTLKVSLGNMTDKWFVNKTETVTIDRTNPSLDIIEDSGVFKGRPINYKCSDTNIDAFSVSDGTTTTNLQKSTSDYVQFIPVTAGTYTFTCTDLAGNSASQAVTVSVSDGFAQPPIATSQSEMNFTNLVKNPYLWIIVIGIIAMLYFGNKK